MMDHVWKNPIYITHPAEVDVDSKGVAEDAAAALSSREHGGHYWGVKMFFG